MFANKVVLVTGGSSGVGAATVILFAKEKASVAFVGRNETRLKEIGRQCLQLGVEVLPIKADITKDEEAKTIIKEIIDKFGRLDVLVNNAGVMQYGALDQPNFMATYDEVMKINLRGVVLVTNLAVESLKETKGTIINYSSVASTMPPNKLLKGTAYSVSKAGVDRFTVCAAMELASFGIRVNSVNPGPAITDLVNKSKLPADLQKRCGTTSLGKEIDPIEVADLILYLASDKARSITGSHYIIDNGLLLT